MKNYLIKYKKNLLQIVGIAFCAILFKNTILLCIAFFLIALLVFAPFYSNLIIQNSDKLLSFIGECIKSTFLFFFFIFIFIPISFLFKIFSKQEKQSTTFFINKSNNDFEKLDFEKLW